MLNFEDIWQENGRRNAEAEAANAACRATIPAPESIDEERRLCRNNFVYWAQRCVKIKDKMSGQLVPFILNKPQRRVAAIMEKQRQAGQPIRLIMLKARQWGGSTLVQMYMAWIQCTQARYWHSLICAQVGKTAASIRGMYDEMLRSYPPELWEGDEQKLVRFQGQELIREISGRGCRITLGSSERQDSIRGADYAMAHLSEVAFWRDSAKSSPADFIRAICGAIATGPLTLIVLESTANGVGNYFHTEWLRSERGESDKVAVFVPWFEIEIYCDSIANRDEAEALWNELDNYEHNLWDMGLRLEQIKWYHIKRREYASHAQMMAEYPSTATEAFTNSGTNVFSAESVAKLRQGCTAPMAYGEVRSALGAITGPDALRRLSFCADSRGELAVWQLPDNTESYVVAVDVGGRSITADWSVIAVFGTRTPRIVAQWRGHTDHDILTWKAAAIARFYNNALLVFESNTLESSADSYAAEETDQGAYMLHELYEYYPNLYWRQAPDGSSKPRPGFHTNRATKQMIITELIGAVRDGAYVETDAGTCDEFSVYQRRSNGSYGARQGYHDDCLMTRAIGLHALREYNADHGSMLTDPDLANFIRG